MQALACILVPDASQQGRELAPCIILLVAGAKLSFNDLRPSDHTRLKTLLQTVQSGAVNIFQLCVREADRNGAGSLRASEAESSFIDDLLHPLRPLELFPDKNYIDKLLDVWIYTSDPMKSHHALGGLFRWLCRKQCHIFIERALNHERISQMLTHHPWWLFRDLLDAISEFKLNPHFQSGCNIHVLILRAIIHLVTTVTKMDSSIVLLDDCQDLMIKILRNVSDCTRDSLHSFSGDPNTALTDVESALQSMPDWGYDLVPLLAAFRDALHQPIPVPGA